MAALFDRSVSARVDLFPGPVVLVHDLPGRLRFVLPALKGGGPAADALCARLRQQHAVRDVTIRAVTGSLLVIYEALPGARDGVLHALHTAGVGIAPQAACRASASPNQGDAGGRLAGTLMKAAFHFMIDHALQGAIAAIV